MVGQVEGLAGGEIPQHFYGKKRSDITTWIALVLNFNAYLQICFRRSVSLVFIPDTLIFNPPARSKSLS